jgi:hypothetical protein
MGIGVALFQNPKYNSGKPWFINFRPPLHNPHKLSEEDLSSYDRFTQELSDLRKQIDGLSASGTDVSDYELDFKLASNKLKEGKFKMADIYIKNLKDQIQ